MSSKLKKAIGVVKDQTSISLAKVSNNASALDIAVLKATTHDEIATSDRYVYEVLQLISSNKAYAASCAMAIAKRIGRTRNWIVTLKSLMLVLRIFQDGDPYFPREVLHAMKRGAKILNLTNFRDDSNSSPWDYTSFVRTFALYLDERLDCFLTGKLQRRFAFRDRENQRHRSRRGSEPIRDMKPAMLLDKISNWQRLLDRAMAMRPTGAAKSNHLVQVSLYAIVQESFDLYCDISDGLALLLDSFFHLQYQSCVNAFHCCVRASKQFEELCVFYDLCKSIGVGRTSEYPSVQKISDELIETLQEFLKDQASFPAHGKSPSRFLSPPSPSTKEQASSFDKGEGYVQSEASETNERFFGGDSELGSQETLLEDLISVADLTGSPPLTVDNEPNSEQFDKQSQWDEFFSANETDSNGGISASSSTSALNFLSFDDWIQATEQTQNTEQVQTVSSAESSESSRNGWELALVEIASQPSRSTVNIENLFSSQNTSFLPDHHYNPFLLDTPELPYVSTTFSTVASPTAVLEPTFQATSNFCTENTGAAAATTKTTLHGQNDPFSSSWSAVGVGGEDLFSEAVDQRIMQLEQQQWLEFQSRIIARHGMI